MKKSPKIFFSTHNLNFDLLKIFKKPLTSDEAFKLLTGALASTIFFILGLMVYGLFKESQLSIQRFGINFFIGTKWDPAISQTFGALPLILGTLTTSAIALLIGAPISLGVGLALSEYMSRKASFIVSFFIELLAAIPSVIYGLWGIFVLIPFLRDNIYPYFQKIFWFIPFFSGPIYGGGVLTGGIILAVMIIPIISAVSRDIFSIVPDSQREAIISLGATKWEVTKIVIKYTKGGIIGAIILGLGRAIGETMAITMVIGNKFQLLPRSLFDAWYTMAAIIANEFTEATSGLYMSALVEVGLVLFIITLIVNIIARLIVWRATRLMGGIARE